MKRHLHIGKEPNLYFWRDNKGKEIDLIIDDGEFITPIEIKSGSTKRSDYFNGLDYWNKISENDPVKSFVIYGGQENQLRNNGKLISWKSMVNYEI